MNDTLAARLCTVLEQIALELATANEQGTMPAQLIQAAPLVPLVPQVRTGQDFIEATTFQPIGPAWVCPVHGTVKTVPAGVARATGKAYDAFLACPEYGCREKPPRGGPAPRPMQPQGRQLP